MDEVFFKSALPVQESSGLEDSSLALPAEISLRTTDKVNPGERSLRVQQQVQLTLARRAKRPSSVGSLRLQKTGRGHDTRDGPLTNTKPQMNGFGHLVRHPSRRVEVSPTQSPELPQRRLPFGSFHFGTYTVPGPTHQQRTGTVLDRSPGSDSFRRYAFSEVTRGTRLNTSTSAHGSHRHKSLRQAVAPQQSTDNGSRWVRHQADVQREKSLVWKQNVQALGAAQHDDGHTCLSQVRRDGVRRQLSYSPSMASMEVDLPIQRVQANSTMALKPENKAPEMTLERAVNLLSQDNEETLICAASFIQNQCFKSADAKKMVFYLHGISKLLYLLQNDSEEEVQRAAAGALRNVVYQSDENKMEVKENEGLATILLTLKSSRDVETRRQLTGLLWNLSSHDLLKERLSREALPVLTKAVLVPSSGISEGENPKDELLADADVFHNATGCLRNLSSAGPDGRKAMRECENLIDSLVYYVRGTIADYKPDDKSTENCVCVLHNLSYQIEAELPQRYARELRESRMNLAPTAKTVGCFSYRGAKITELERQCPLLEEKANPRGMEWLWSAITIRMYLSLIARSVRHCTQEAAVGALQNITAGNGLVTEAIAHTIVQRENGLQHVRKILQEGGSNVKRTTVSLVKNISRYMELHPDIVKQVLPEVVSLLPNDDTGTDQSTEFTTSLCHILSNLCQSDTLHVKAIVNHGALRKIINISTKDSGYGPTRAGQAASTLLHTMWKHSELHGAYRKCGYRKTDFINARTTKAVNSG
ncbi:plakophilin-2 isoform X2 [Genypterus blacodes]|uniref:plakophilin-2 isoform X2 n=1 Tax=Genypterus blacodes TaxID=154954 RepID=UPI003F776B45